MLKPDLLNPIDWLNITPFHHYYLEPTTSYKRIYRKPTTAIIMPVNHIVLFQFKADASPEAVQKVRLPLHNV